LPGQKVLQCTDVCRSSDLDLCAQTRVEQLSPEFAVVLRSQHEQVGTMSGHGQQVKKSLFGNLFAPVCACTTEESCRKRVSTRKLPDESEAGRDESTASLCRIQWNSKKIPAPVIVQHFLPEAVIALPKREQKEWHPAQPAYFSPAQSLQTPGQLPAKPLEISPSRFPVLQELEKCNIQGTNILIVGSSGSLKIHSELPILRIFRANPELRYF
jgi:hypothetical protein